MSEKYSGTLSQETDFSKNKKQISVGITEVYFLYPFLWKTGIKRGLKRLRNDIFCRITCEKIKLYLIQGGNKMNMKVRKSVIAFLMATTMVGSTAVPAMAGQITVKIQAGVEGRVFGSISSKEIALEAKKQLNMDIDKKKIIIPDAIKSLGTYNVNIKLHKDVMATLAVKVEAK